MCNSLMFVSKGSAQFEQKLDAIKKSRHGTTFNSIKVSKAYNSMVLNARMECQN